MEAKSSGVWEDHRTTYITIWDADYGDVTNCGMGEENALELCRSNLTMND